MSNCGRSPVPAVVVGAGINGLGVVRSLARAGVPVVLLDSSNNRPGMRSRYGRKRLYSDDGEEAVVEALEGLAGELGGARPVLLLTQESTVATVATHQARLADLYRFTMPRPEPLATLMHKDGVRAVAESAGARIPKTLRIRRDDEIDGIDTLQPPLVIKPASRNAAYSGTFSKAYRTESIAEARLLLQRILPIYPDVMVQEWIEGADSDIYFCLQYLPPDGASPTAFVGRKLRSWPPQVGGTASCVAAPEAAELVAATTDFFRHAGLTGLASMEYKRDSRTGEYVTVEPTVGRTDYQEEIATLNGVNIPWAAYRGALGRTPVSAAVVRPARLWRVRASDIQAAQATPEHNPRVPGNARVVDALWRPTDPMPALVPVARRMRARLQRIGRRADRRDGTEVR